MEPQQMMFGHLVSPKSGSELMQNCDLPPPMKVFIAPDTVILSPINRIYGMMGPEHDKDKIDEKFELMKALRFSQTRAREAEKKAVSLEKERDVITNALLKESLTLFAYRQCVRMLEIQVSGTKNQEKQFCCRDKWEGKEEEDNDHCGMPWIVALAICLGIAGVGFSFGCKYF